MKRKTMLERTVSATISTVSCDTDNVTTKKKERTFGISEGRYTRLYGMSLADFNKYAKLPFDR